MSIEKIELQSGTLTRAGYTDLPVPADLLGLTPEVVADIPWSDPIWATESQPRLGAAAWFAETGGIRLVFDPIQALDVVFRADRETELATRSAVTELFAQAGYPLESIDLVVISHLEDVGMVAQRDDDGSWIPTFPNARILISDLELSAFQEPAAKTGDGTPDATRDAWTSLIENGHVQSFSHGDTIAPGIVADVSGGHSAGHTVFHFGHAKIPDFSLIGHLAVTPLHLATGECAALNRDPLEAWRLLQENANDGRLIAGALWPTPGYGRWVEGELQAGP